MLDVKYFSKQHKIFRPLAGTLIDIAQKSLDLRWQDEQTAIHFAAKVFQGHKPGDISL